MCKYMFSRAGMGPRMRFACVCLYTFLDYLQLNNIARRSSEVCACVFPVPRKRCVCRHGNFSIWKTCGNLPMWAL